MDVVSGPSRTELALRRAVEVAVVLNFARRKYAGLTRGWVDDRTHRTRRAR